MMFFGLRRQRNADQKRYSPFLSTLLPIIKVLLISLSQNTALIQEINGACIHRMAGFLFAGIFSAAQGTIIVDVAPEALSVEMRTVPVGVARNVIGSCSVELY
jgi:hypothetical protein